MCQVAPYVLSYVVRTLIMNVFPGRVAGWSIALNQFGYNVKSCIGLHPKSDMV